MKSRTLGQINGMAKRYSRSRAKGNFLIAEQFERCYEAGYMRAVRDYWGTQVEALRASIQLREKKR